MKKSYITSSYKPIETTILDNDEGLEFAVEMFGKILTFHLMPASRDSVFDALHPDRNLPLDFEYSDLSDAESWKVFDYLEDELILFEMGERNLEFSSTIHCSEPEPWVDHFGQFLDTLAGFR